MMSRALERAMSSFLGKRQAFTTADLAAGIFQAASEGVRCEETLAKRAIAHAQASCQEVAKITEGAAG
jgi:hypothetical protein